jgi:hypothetical protein
VWPRDGTAGWIADQVSAKHSQRAQTIRPFQRAWAPSAGKDRV